MNNTTMLKDLISSTTKFEPEVDYKDLDWEFYLKIGRSWRVLQAKLYNDIMYFGSDDWDSFSVDTQTYEASDLPEDHPVQAQFSELIEALNNVYHDVGKDFISYHRNLMRRLPPGLRKGVLHRSIVRKLIPEWFAFDQQLSSSEMEESLSRLQKYETGIVEKMTAGIYFHYCKIAYLANPESFTSWQREDFDPSLSGQELYRTYADGRDGGLKKIDPDSEEAFQNWYEHESGGHPWEIYRGGNSTHIDLAVVRENDAWSVKLITFSSARLIETCRIAIALERAELPFEWVHAKSHELRLRAEDYVGIVPASQSLAYAWHRFPKKFNVADCIHYSWFRSEETNKPLWPWSVIKGVVTWLPVRPLRIKELGRG